MRPLAIAALVLVALPARASAEPDIELHGRVFARSTLSKVEVVEDIDAPWLWTQSVASGRVGVEYRHERSVKVSVEVEFSGGDADMKDVYVRYEPGRREWSLKAGRFKKPISAVQLDGLWDLPIIERGVLTELEVSGVALPVGGRGDGISLAFDPERLPFSVELALFQPEVLVPIDATEELGADVYGRVELDVTDDVEIGMTLAAAGYLEKPERGRGFRHAPVAGFDLYVNGEVFHLWADVMAGIDPLPFALDVATIDLPCDTESMSCPPAELIADRGVFVAARGVASAKLEPGRVLRTVEPFVSATVIDLNTRFAADEVRQLGGGVASKINKRLRWQLHADRTSAARDAPAGDATRVMLQLGASF